MLPHPHHPRHPRPRSDVASRSTLAGAAARAKKEGGGGTRRRSRRTRCATYSSEILTASQLTHRRAESPTSSPRAHPSSHPDQAALLLPTKNQGTVSDHVRSRSHTNACMYLKGSHSATGTMSVGCSTMSRVSVCGATRILRRTVANTTAGRREEDALPQCTLTLLLSLQNVRFLGVCELQRVPATREGTKAGQPPRLHGLLRLRFLETNH